jgi:hypothetical protein
VAVNTFKYSNLLGLKGIENKATKQRIEEDRAPVLSIPETGCTEHRGKIFMSMCT